MGCEPQPVRRTFTFAATGQSEAVSRRYPLRAFAIGVIGQGAAPTSWTVLLEGTLDGENWSTIATHNTAVGNTELVFAAGAVEQFRVNVTALTLGGASAIAVPVLALP